MAVSQYRLDYDRFINQAQKHLPGARRSLLASMYIDAIKGNLDAECALQDAMLEDDIDPKRIMDSLAFGRQAYASWTAVRKRQFDYYVRKYGLSEIE